MLLLAVVLAGSAAGCDIHMGAPQTSSTGSDVHEIRPREKSERLQFVSGKTSGSWTREIPADGAIDFVIGARKGQKIAYTAGYDFGEDEIETTLIGPESQEILWEGGPNKRIEFPVARSGDHHLRVRNTTGRNLTLTLYLEIK